MSHYEDIADLMARGAGTPAPEPLAALYRQAYAEYGLRALWSRQPVANPTVASALAITESLRVEGDLAARRLAEQIEKLARAAV